MTSVAEASSLAQPKLTNKWLALLLLLGISIFNYGDRYLLAGLVDPIKTEFGVSDSFMGLLLGPAFAIFYSILAVPIAIFADRISRINIICAGCVVWSFFTVISGFAETPAMLAAARVGVGVGEAAFQAPAFSLIAAYFPPNQRGKAFAVMALSVYLGQILGYTAGPKIASYDDWRLAFIVMGGSGLIVVALAWLFVKEPPREAVRLATSSLPMLQRMGGFCRDLWRVFMQLVAARSYTFMMLGMGLGVLSGSAFGFWGPTLFARSYEISLIEAGAAFGGAFTVPAIIGTISFGALADFLSKKGYDRPLMLSSIALAFATLSVMGAVWAADIDIALVWAIPAGLLGGGWAVGIYAGLQYILPDRMRATGTALAMLVINMLGYVIGPWVVGAVSDIVASDGSALRESLTIVVPIGIVGAVLVWLGAKKLEQDRQKLETTTSEANLT